jgi:hypothetical protein
MDARTRQTKATPTLNAEGRATKQVNEKALPKAMVVPIGCVNSLGSTAANELWIATWLFLGLSCGLKMRCRNLVTVSCRHISLI